VNELTDEIKKLDESLSGEEKRSLSAHNAEAARERLRGIRGAWPHMDMRERRSLIASVIDRITITHKSVRIDYRC
jgi:hypothetical protein